MDTIDKNIQHGQDPEKATAEKLGNSLTESSQNTANMPDDNEELVPVPEKIADPETPVNISMTDFVTLELQQLREQLLRVQADFDNYRRRAARDQDDLRRFACTDLIGELLPILDSFEIGLKSAQENSNTLSGFQMIFTQLQTLLVSKGMKEIAPHGEVFNPQWEEAVAYVFDENVPPEHVVQTVRRGYLLYDRLLRPAAVVVSKGAQREEK
ncbi:MAG: nucleotide exchange factor GrpE [Puniceicoccales bacterium]|jgi:molecular chaperone GrpE|nr:nucleotide exchange factor GrpE [Puniceicoccales bacterium]